jgi:hypothetical protein
MQSDESPAQGNVIIVEPAEMIRPYGDMTMMNEGPDQYFEQQDMAVKLVLLENKSDELTDILVEALQDALKLLEEELSTVH